jgi:hypothetical protein
MALLGMTFGLFRALTFHTGKGLVWACCIIVCSILVLIFVKILHDDDLREHQRMVVEHKKEAVNTSRLKEHRELFHDQLALQQNDKIRKELRDAMLDTVEVLRELSYGKEAKAAKSRMDKNLRLILDLEALHGSDD